MSDASTRQAVECPICGDEFDPTVAGGWCTNTECGEWQYTEDSNDSDVGDADVESTADQSDDDGFVSPAQEADEPESVDLFDDDEEATDGAESEAADEADEAHGEGDDDVDETGTDEAEETPTDPADEAEAEDADEVPDTVDCPDCGVELDGDANFCPECGADVSDVAPTDETLDACPGCGNDVDDDDNFCVNCGEDLDAHREAAGDATDDVEADDDGLQESLVLEVEGREITVEDGDTVGREIRAALTDAGRPDDEAVRIHREHVRFVREEGSYYLLDLGDNPTQLNGETLHKGDREEVTPGDELELSGVAAVTVQAP